MKYAKWGKIIFVKYVYCISVHHFVLLFEISIFLKSVYKCMKIFEHNFTYSNMVLKDVLDFMWGIGISSQHTKWNFICTIFFCQQWNISCHVSRNSEHICKNSHISLMQPLLTLPLPILHFNYFVKMIYSKKTTICLITENVTNSQGPRCKCLWYQQPALQWHWFNGG